MIEGSGSIPPTNGSWHTGNIANYFGEGENNWKKYRKINLHEFGVVLHEEAPPQTKQVGLMAHEPTPKRNTILHDVFLDFLSVFRIRMDPH